MEVLRHPSYRRVACLRTYRSFDNELTRRLANYGPISVSSSECVNSMHYEYRLQERQEIERYEEGKQVSI